MPPVKATFTNMVPFVYSAGWGRGHSVVEACLKVFEAVYNFGNEKYEKHKKTASRLVTTSLLWVRMTSSPVFLILP